MTKTRRCLVERSMFAAVAILVQFLRISEAGIISHKYGVYYQGVAPSLGDGGSASSASLSFPISSWMNTIGEVYISDQIHFRIRKVDLSGIIGTVFGTGTFSVTGDGGPATSATGEPIVVHGDSAGNIYFSDLGYVRKIDTSLIVTRFAGGGTLGNGLSTADNGAAATSSKFNSDTGVCTDSNGDVYLADSMGHKIKKVSSSTHILTYVAGTGTSASLDISAYNGDGGPATSAPVTLPYGIFIDSTGILYFSSDGSGIIRKIDLQTGIISLFAGGTTGKSGYSGDGGPATSALLQGSGPNYIACDRSGRVYFTAQYSNNVRVISTSGIINRFAGSTSGTSGYTGNEGQATAATLYLPAHVFVNGTSVYITENGNHVVRTVAITLGSDAPTLGPSAAPTDAPTLLPSLLPSVVPSLVPTLTPSVDPSVAPTEEPTLLPSLLPTVVPTLTPTLTPSVDPSVAPTCAPSLMPSLLPTVVPSLVPTVSPTAIPSMTPSSAIPTLTFAPTVSPTATPGPSKKPTTRPSVRPSRAGVTITPTALPTVSPTLPIVVISFNSSIVLHNVTASTLDGTSQSAVTSSVATTLNISSNQVSYVSQTLIGGARRSRRRRQLRVEQVYQILMTVNVVASTADFVVTVNQNGSYLYNMLTTVLTDAVESNVFARTVRETSATLGASATRYVGYVNLTVSGYTDVTPAAVTVAHHHRESGLSAGAIAGIVIGGVAALMLMVCLCLRYNRKKQVVAVLA